MKIAVLLDVTPCTLVDIYRRFSEQFAFVLSVSECPVLPDGKIKHDTVTAKIGDMRKVKVKVKVTLVQALRLCTGRTAHSGSRGIALLFHDQRHWKGVRG